MSSCVTDTNVLIVGAGPVGLFLSNERARRNLHWKLVEARASQFGRSARFSSGRLSRATWSSCVAGGHGPGRLNSTLIHLVRCSIGQHRIFIESKKPEDPGITA